MSGCLNTSTATQWKDCRKICRNYAYGFLQKSKTLFHILNMTFSFFLIPRIFWQVSISKSAFFSMKKKRETPLWFRFNLGLSIYIHRREHGMIEKVWILFRFHFIHQKKKRSFHTSNIWIPSAGISTFSVHLPKSIDSISASFLRILPWPCTVCRSAYGLIQYTVYDLAGYVIGMSESFHVFIPSSPYMLCT